ncbi:unnamed protein product [Phytophthora lilii]|uniref:Unnamed protein product n=1 Tax=Phytophthora lilii TaxID=2077276 RepID=A0A9W6YH70_9STRA|nr:unnamed protein product [Phytophthora lilii]
MTSSPEQGESGEVSRTYSFDKQLISLSEDLSPSSVETTGDAKTADTNTNISRLERRREQSRTRQLRYLQRKRQYENDLQSSVDTLQSDVRGMELQLQFLRTGEPCPCSCPTSSINSLPPSLTPTTTSSNFLQTARDLVHCFRFGFSTTASPPWIPCSSSCEEQIHFVQNAMHPDVLHGELRGQNSFLEQWRRYTAFFGSLELHPHNFALLPSANSHAVCRAQLTLSLQLVMASFQHVFPHLLQPQHSSLLGCLLNHQIRVPTTLQLQFDARGRVCRCDSALDFVAALRPLLNSYADVANVLQRAHISPCGHLGPGAGPLDLAFVLSPST